MNIYNDERVVLTLDAGGTNFVFNAFKSGKAITGGIRKDSNADHLERCLATMKEGFSEVIQSIEEIAVAISFAFPGPADYANGIIDNSNNLPAFQGGVPLKSILEEEFGLPVYINNDGDLFAYGEALGGILPEINSQLEASGSPKRYKNLFGFTLGTGFGGGFVSNGQLITGDNVMFFFTNGAASKLNGSAELVLTPPDSGDYSGILFFGDRTEPGLTHHVNGGSGTSFGGAVHFAYYSRLTVAHVLDNHRRVFASPQRYRFGGVCIRHPAVVSIGPVQRSLLRQEIEQLPDLYKVSEAFFSREWQLERRAAQVAQQDGQIIRVDQAMFGRIFEEVARVSRHKLVQWSP